MEYRHRSKRSSIRSPRKPVWVKKEILRLCSFLPDHGCRRLANQFNRIYHTSGESVSKSYAHRLKQDHQYEINSIRRIYKNRIPKAMPIHKIWGLDLTGKFIDDDNKQILGIIDHGSRLLLSLEHIRTKSTIRVLRIILEVIEKTGKPKVIRPDNEPIFLNPIFKFSLKALGISHQRTKLHSPWQNGRIERLFWSLKEKMNRVSFNSISEYQNFLQTFRFWYNHARPHQHLGGVTPIEYFNGDVTPAKKVSIYSEYDGLFQGLLIKR